MTWPSGMTTCTVSVGRIYDAQGNPCQLSGSVKLLFPDGVTHLVFGAESITAESAPITISGDGTGLSVLIPHCDQSGLALPTGMSLSGSAPLMGAEIDVKAKYLDGSILTYPILVQPLVGTSTLDVDPIRWKAEGASVVTGVVVHTGLYATITLGSTTTGSPGTSANVTNTGTDTEAILNFTIPKGDTGATGSAATVAVGTTTTGAAGTSASVTNSGTSSEAVFNFTIPKGDKGDTGNPGFSGMVGPAGSFTGTYPDNTMIFEY